METGVRDTGVDGGPPPPPPGGTESVVQMVRQIRRKLGDFPDSVLVLNALTPASADDVLTLDANQGIKIPTAGVILESDDWGLNSAIEDVLVVSITDDTAMVRRGFQDPTTIYAHAAGTFFLINPRFRQNTINDALAEVASTHLWPDVWTWGHATITPDPSTEYYACSLTNVAEVAYAYQLAAGVKYRVRVEFLGPDLVDPTAYPNGMFVMRPMGVPYPDAGHPVYVSCKTLPQLPITMGTPSTDAPIGADINSLFVLGAVSILGEMEELRNAAPSRASIEALIQAGTALRTGETLWARFHERRASVRSKLLAELARQLNDLVRGK